MTYLFTIICQYKGGTYTKQLVAESPVQAFEQWTIIFKSEDVLSATEKKKFGKEVEYVLADSNIVALEGLQNVWYEGFSLDDDLLEVIVVGMSEQVIVPAPIGKDQNIAYRPSDPTIRRVQWLLEGEKTGVLKEEEREELDHYLLQEDLMIIAKARANTYKTGPKSSTPQV